MAAERFALSLKQPWAALVVAGLKSVEIRRWSTNRVGRIYIHASKIPDARPEAWKWVPASLRPKTGLLGGLIGSVTLTGCMAYESAPAFEADRPLHLNHPDWYHSPVMYGFTLTSPQPMRFRPLLGNIKFFPVPTP